MASADFNNVTLRNIAPANADGSFVRADYVFTVSSNGKQNWTNNLNLNQLVVSTISVNSTVRFTNGIYDNIYISSLFGSTMTTQTAQVTSTLHVSTLNGTNAVISNFFGSSLMASTLTGSTIYYSTMIGERLTTSTLNVSTLYAPIISYSTITGNTIIASTIFASTVYYSTGQGSTLTVNILNASNLNLNNGFYSTLTGSSIITSTLSVSSLSAAAMYYSTLQGSSLTTSTLFGSTINFSTSQGSTLTANIANASILNLNNGFYSTLTGSSIITSSLSAPAIYYSTLQGSSLITSTLFGSTINFSTSQGSTLIANIVNVSNLNMNNGFYSTLTGSTLTANTLFWNSTLTGSTMIVTTVNYSTLQGSTINTNTLSANALTIVSTLTASSILTTSLGYSSMNGSTITTSTMNIATLLIISSGNVGIGMTNPTYALQTSTLNSVNLSGNYIENWTTVLSSSDSTAFTPTFNGTQSGPSGSPSAMSVLLGSSSNTVLTYNRNVIPGNVYQLTFTAKMTGTSPSFTMCDHLSTPTIDQQIPGTTTQSITGSYVTYTVTFTAPSGNFAISFNGQAGGGTTVSYYGVQLQAFVNQMIGGLGIGTTNPQYSLHVPKGSIQAYNFQQFEWINTQTNNTIGYSPATSAGLYKVATMGAFNASGTYGMINVRGQIGGFLNSNTMYVDLAIISRGGLTVWGTVYGSQSAAGLCDVVYNLNSNSQYDIYIYIKSASYIVYDLMVSGASGNNILYDPVGAAVVAPGVLTLTSLSAMANIYPSTGGYIGIGTTAPGNYALDVNGTLNVRASFTVNGVAVATGTGSVWTVGASNAISYSAGNTCLSRNRLIFSNSINDFNHSIFNNNNNLDSEGVFDGIKYNGYNGHWFRVGNASGAVPTTAMFINVSGQIGIGNTTPSYQLQLSTDSAAKPSTNTWTISSDERLKENIVLADVDRCVEIIRTVPLKHYRWKDTVYTQEQVKDRSKLGWIAQDIEKVFPKAVSTHPFHYNQVYEDAMRQDGSMEKRLVSEDVIDDCRDLNADQIYAVMYGAIQKLITENDTLQTTLASVFARLTALENK